MARPRNIQRTIEKKVCIPETTVAKVDLELYSDLEGRVPVGAWKELVTKLLDNWLHTIHLAKAKKREQNAE